MTSPANELRPLAAALCDTPEDNLLAIALRTDGTLVVVLITGQKYTFSPQQVAEAARRVWRSLVGIPAALRDRLAGFFDASDPLPAPEPEPVPESQPGAVPSTAPMSADIAAPPKKPAAPKTKKAAPRANP